MKQEQKKRKKRVRKGKAVYSEQRNKQWHEYNRNHKYYKLRSLESPGLQEEIDKWYKILEEDGFEDIEKSGTTKRHGNEVNLQPTKLPPRRSINSKAKQLYYAAWQTYFVHNEHQIQPRREYIIFECMGEGLTVAKISALLRSKGFRKKIAATTIRSVIKQWEPVVMKWNEEHPDGEFFVAPSNFWENPKYAKKVELERKEIIERIQDEISVAHKSAAVKGSRKCFM